MIAHGGAPLLSVRDLCVAVDGPAGHAVIDAVSFDVPEGGVVGIVGESGCGKSVTALSILRLISPALRIMRGEILFAGDNLMLANDERMRQIRGGEIGMVFQEPMTSLNPVFTVGDQVAETVQAHQALGRRAARAAAIELLSMAGIPSPERRVDSFPHQMSGGMCQRVMIAMALACKPRLLIADEPTTALDVTIQAQIIELLRRLRRELGMAVLIITHDLGVIADFAETVVVMYAGRIVERSATREIFDKPRHPYTQNLLASIPPLDSDVDRLLTIAGTVPSPRSMPRGCRFSPRCTYVESKCRAADPPLAELSPGHLSACIRAVAD